MPWKEKRVLDQRAEFVLKSLGRGVVFSGLCKEYGISRKTGYKWRERFLQEGLCGLRDLSRKPRTSASMLAEETVCEIVRLKTLHRFWGPRKIRELYLRSHGEAPSASSFKRVLDRAGLVERRKRRPRRAANRLRAGKKAAAPNDIWTVDFKGWWKTARGQRCEPLTIRDDYSRFILSVKAFDTPGTAAVKAEFIRVFERNGLPEVIRSDNGSPFASSRSPLGLSALSVWFVAQGIELDRIEPGRPEQNGGHERMHRDIRMELQGLIEGDLEDHQAAFESWRHDFNWVRPHEALGMRLPGEVYRKSRRAYEAQIPQIQYPPQYLIRKVSNAGMLTVADKRIFISSSLRGWHVGLKPVTMQTLEVWFDNLRLGEIDLTAEAFIEADGGCHYDDGDNEVSPMS
jgi:putative transposase